MLASQWDGRSKAQLLENLSGLKQFIKQEAFLLRSWGGNGGVGWQLDVVDLQKPKIKPYTLDFSLKLITLTEPMHAKGEVSKQEVSKTYSQLIWSFFRAIICAAKCLFILLFLLFKFHVSPEGAKSLLEKALYFMNVSELVCCPEWTALQSRCTRAPFPTL